MQFSDTSTSQGLIQDITALLGGGVDLNSYKIADRTRNINERFRQVWPMIFDSYGGWKFQDDNSNALPYADQNITSGTGTYTLPTGALTVRYVEVLTVGGTWQRLRPLTEEEFKMIGGDANLVTTSTPVGYMLYEDQIRLYGTPNYSYTNGLRIYFDRDISTFATTDTTKTPGFASPYHKILSIGAALDYAAPHSMSVTSYLQGQWDTYERNIRSFYSKRWLDRYPHNLPPQRDLVREFN